MFPLCQTEHKYWDMNVAHSSLNVFINLSEVCGTRPERAPPGWPGIPCTRGGRFMR